MGEVAGQGGSGPGGPLARIRQRIADDRRQMGDPVATFVSVCTDLQELEAACRLATGWNPILGDVADTLHEVLDLAVQLASLIHAHRAIQANDAVQSALEPAPSPYPTYEGGRVESTSFPVE